MGSTGLPFPTSNNAPLPVPGGYGNPTGANFGSFGTSTGQPFPTMPAFGGPSSNAGPFTGTNIGGLNAGILGYGQGYGTDVYNMLGKAYGKGTGQVLGDLLGGKLFNPDVAAAFLNAQQPGISRGEASITNAFGDAGARFSSAAGVGLGDYESQVQLNQQKMLAEMFQNAQMEEVGLLSSLLPTIHQERADASSWANKLAGAFDIFSSMVSTDPKKGGKDLMSGIGLLGGGSGASSNADVLAGSGGGFFDSLSKMASMFTGGGSSMFNSMSQPNMNTPASGGWDMDMMMQNAGAGALGGGDSGGMGMAALAF